MTQQEETALRAQVAQLIAENERLRAKISAIIHEAMIAVLGGRT